MTSCLDKYKLWVLCHNVWQLGNELLTSECRLDNLSPRQAKSTISLASSFVLSFHTPKSLFLIIIISIVYSSLFGRRTSVCICNCICMSVNGCISWRMTIWAMSVLINNIRMSLRIDTLLLIEH